MKNRYIDELLSEIQQLESKVANLKKSQHVSFSFFKDSFKRTQEISRLLHELEFVQIEDMKGQMERLVQFLSEAQEAKEEAVEVIEPMTAPGVKESTEVTRESISDDVETENTAEENIEETVDVVSTKEAEITTPEAESKADIVEEIEVETVLAQNETVGKRAPATDQASLHNNPVTSPSHQSTPPSVRSIINQHKETIVENLGVKNKSLNDVLPVNPTIQDAKRSISLNDRFLFQRELFDNNREAMNTMMTNLQPFTSFDAIENYLKENTNWNFKDETVDKFMQMLKDSFR